jgi:hypothetical protein
MPEAQPQIIVAGDYGRHNATMEATADRVRASKAYRDCSTVVVIPTRGMIPARAVQAWMDMIPMMNQPLTRMFIVRMEIGDAYNAAVEWILNDPTLSNWKYMLTLEEDNVPPPDGLVRLIEAMNEERHYAAIGGLYFTKGEGGMPMIYGNPGEILDFRPQVPVDNVVQECNGLGMGFTLFRIDVFKDERIPRPWFKTLNSWSAETGGQAGTQDLYFFKHAREAGYRVASHNAVKVGHWDETNQILW